MLRRIRTVLLVSAALFGVLLGTLAVIGVVYEDEVKARLLTALNAHLNGPVDVGSMDLTLIRRFPQASLHLRKVLALEALANKPVPDTLLYAEDLYLEFGLWDLFGGNYTVQEVHGDHVLLYPGREADGSPNWLLWKSDTTATAGSGLDLDQVTVKDLTLRYRDAGSAVEIRGWSGTMAMRGHFTDALNEVQLKGDIHLAQWLSKDDVVLSDRTASVKLNMSFGGADGAFRITDGQVHTGDVPLEITLALVPGANGDELDLRANGLGLDLADVITLLPEPIMQRLRRYNLKGEVDLALHYAGPMEGPGPALSVGMTMRNGRMKERNSGATFEQINAELAFDLTPAGVPKRILVKGLTARSNGGTVSGSLDLSGTTNAPIKLSLRTDVALADLLHFAQVDTLEQVTGRMKADVQVNGRMRDVGDIKVTDLRALVIGGTLGLRDASLKLKGVRHRITALNADLRLLGNDASLEGVTAEIQGNPIQLEGELRGLMPYLLFDGQKLTIAAQLRSPRIDLATLLQSDEATVTSSGSSYALKLPALIELDLRTDVQELVFEKFTATSVSGTIRLKDRVLTAAPVTFLTASGGVLGSLSLDGRSTASYPLTINATVRDIAIDQLFAEFKDFGQEFITGQHLKGRASMDIAFSAPLSPDMQMDMDRLHCLADLRIDNGELIGHRPMIDIAEHLKKNKLVAPFVDTDALREQLAHITFDRLEDQIEIRDRTVFIPGMTVRSSVMDLNLSGQHSFDDRIDHHFDFRLADLFRKGKVKDEFGPVVDDGTGMRIYLHMYGTASDPQFENDGAMAAAKRKQQYQQEKQELRSILKNELGLFTNKNDDRTATAGGGAGTTTGPVLQVEWGAPDSTATPPPDSRPKKKGFGKFLENVTKEGEEKETFEVID